MSVIQLNKLTSVNQEFNALSNALSFQDWTFKAQNIIQSTGLPLNTDFTNKDVLLPNGSMANRFGHKTLVDYITSNKSTMGHSYQWNDWCNEYKALEFKTKFGIYETCKFEILKQVGDIEIALGRTPIDSAEFHQVKDDILLRQKRDTEVRHQSEIRNLTSIISNLTKKLEDSKNDIKLIEEKLEGAIPESLIISYVEQLKEKEQEIIDLKEKVSILKANTDIDADFDINKLVENYHSVLEYLSKFRSKNKLLKKEIVLLKNEVGYLKSELRIKNKLVKKLFAKNNQLTNISLITTSLFIGSLSMMLFYLMMMSL